VIPNQEKIPGVKYTYKLTGNDQIQAINNKTSFDFNEA